MNDSKFIGLDVHKTSISAAVLDHDGKLVMQSVFATHAAAILSFIRGLRGTLRMTFEELTQAGRRYRAERMFEQLDALQGFRRQARRDLFVECRKHAATAILTSIPFLGPIRAALLIARVQTPFRFRGKRQFWAYCGLALETRSSADYRLVEGELHRAKKPVFIRGLNLNHNHDLENIFKAAATTASACPGPFRDYYEILLGKGMKPEMARLTLARKIAAISLIVWKKGERFDPEQLKAQAA